MSEPRVSVVLPVRNGETYLAEAIASVLSQTFTALELIVVDDGSGDQTPSIIRSYAADDPRLRLARASTGGIVNALNHGCALARAPLIARMDADDISYPDRIARQVERLDGAQGVVLVACAVDSI